MKAADLIKKLQEFPPETPVFVRGFVDEDEDVVWSQDVTIITGRYYGGRFAKPRDWEFGFAKIPAIAINGSYTTHGG